METNEIMTNEEVTEAVETVAEEIVTKGSGSKLKAAAIGGLAVLIGGLAVQYIVIPTVAKIKAKRQNANTIDSGFTVVGADEAYDSGEEVEEEK